jgi:hypothetical protein
MTHSLDMSQRVVFLQVRLRSHRQLARNELVRTVLCVGRARAEGLLRHRPASPAPARLLYRLRLVRTGPEQWGCPCLCLPPSHLRRS